MSSQDLIGLGKNRPTRSFDDVTMWIADAADGQEPGFTRLNFGDIRPYCGDPLTKAQLGTCMLLASQQQRPPTAWLLVRDARSLLRSDEYRRAVLDAGAAAELALTAMLDKHAAETNSHEVEREVTKTKMLGPLHRRANKLIPSAVPKNLREQVIDPRNAATHEAQSLTKEVAAKAIATTTELLIAAHPLSEFGFDTETAATVVQRSAFRSRGTQHGR